MARRKKMYSKRTLKRFRNPRNAGVMKNPDAVGEVGNMKCGDIMKIFIKVNEGKIKKIKFQTYGCVAAIAASDMLCELARDKTLEDASKIKYSDVTRGLGELPQVKIHCSVLGTKALRKAIENYRSGKLKV